MAVDVYAVRVGDRYGVEYESYLRSKLPHIKFLTSPEPDLHLQWNKLHFFKLQVKNPIVVIDVDIELHNDYIDLINYPIEPGEFLTLDPWWDPQKQACDINGGFYKFYPSDTKYIYDEFISRPDYWREYYIKQKIKPGPVNGEENFVSYMIKKRLRTKFVPASWFSTMWRDPQKKTLSALTAKYSGPYIVLGNKIHPQIKLLHYNGMNNLQQLLNEEHQL